MSWTVQERQKCLDQQTKYPRVWANDHNWGTNHFIWQGKNASYIPLGHSSRRLPFYRGIPPFWTTNLQRPESTFEYRGEPTNRDKVDELTSTGTHASPFTDHDCTCLVSSIRVRVWSLSVSLSIQIAKFGWVQTFWIKAKGFDQLGVTAREPRPTLRNWRFQNFDDAIRQSSITSHQGKIFSQFDRARLKKF